MQPPLCIDVNTTLFIAALDTKYHICKLCNFIVEQFIDHQQFQFFQSTVYFRLVGVNVGNILSHIEKYFDLTFINGIDDIRCLFPFHQRFFVIRVIIRQTPHITRTLDIVLPAKRHQSGTLFTDIGGHDGKIANRGCRIRAVKMFCDPQPPQDNRLFRGILLCYFFDHLRQIFITADFLKKFRIGIRISQYFCFVLLKIFGALFDERGIVQFFRYDRMRHHI